jgi:hypothetical protein
MAQLAGIAGTYLALDFERGCYVTDDLYFDGFSPRASEEAALKLRARMEAAGISVWHPDPLGALNAD